MKSTLIVALLTFLRLGIPAIILLSLGEAFRRHTGATKASVRGRV